MASPKKIATILFNGHKTRNLLPVLSAKSYNSAASEPFLNGSTSNYVEEMYNNWLRDPTSVHTSWDAYFRSNTYAAPPNLAPTMRNMVPLSAVSGSAMAVGQPDEKIIDDHLAVQAIIRSYQSRGHLAAELDPLGIINPESSISKDGVARRANEAVLRQHSWFMMGNLFLHILLKAITIFVKFGVISSS
uniref:2-oxoglutarate dehydrogenase, mitochondrial n=1 Tax=Megaselia scalaris TaxID=36166 RepID=T1GXX1_MEGSC